MSRLFFALGAALGVLVASPVVRGDTPVNFQFQVRPILANSCFTCHGPDDSHREADLRLDVRELAIKSAIRPGQSGKSPLIGHITSQDPDERMPPPDSGRPAIKPEQVEILRRWIDQGAPYSHHWSYEPAARPQTPSLPATTWILNPLDAFVLTGLNKAGLRPSPEADRQTLIRRLSYDLTGLPPTPEEVEAFVADKSPDAYEKLVDRLLASPHYGERMALRWLDLVRYADTEGYHGDQERTHWLYRDYVIQAFNSNMLFDRFTTEQLAGDLLPKPTRAQRIASGYNRLGMTTAEGGAQAKEYIAKYAADRVRNAGTVWLGSTIGCAECHNHKFDPFLTRDFYRFAAFFADLDEVIVGHQKPSIVLSEPLQNQVDALAAQMKELEKQINATSPEIEAAQAKWEQTAKVQLPQWKPLMPKSITTQSGRGLRILDDGVIMALTDGPETDTYTIVVNSDLVGINALRLEGITDPTFPSSGPGRSDFGEFILSEVNVRLGEDEKPAAKVEEDKGVAGTGAEPLARRSPGTNAGSEKEKGAKSAKGGNSAKGEKGAMVAKPPKRPNIKLSDAVADFSRPEAPASAAIDGNPKTGWDIYHVAGKDHAIEMRLPPIAGKPGTSTVLTIELVQQGGARKTLGKFRLLASATPRDAKGIDGRAVPLEIIELLRGDASKRTEAERKQMTAYYRTFSPELAAIRSSLAKLKQQREVLLKKGDEILVAERMKPRMMRVLPRGNWQDETGEEVKPGAPEFMPQIDSGKQTATRLDLARWLVDPKNPLVARVYVNRLWAQMFGRGIVSTADDFGSQGAAPSHPELLDFLATDFASHWDTKRMLKMMAMSATYRQSSVGDAKARQTDPANVWLSRQGRFRLEAELVRDNALAVSGLLVRTIGGPSVKPYQPAGYYSHLNFPKREYQQDHGSSLYRRGLYTHWQRTFLHPSLSAFDAPSREECTVERCRSNTPLAALAMLNDPSYVEAARALATKAMREGGKTPQERIAYVMRQTLGRPAESTETEVLQKLYEKHLAEYQADPKAADQLLAIGESPLPSNVVKTELAAWTSVARAVLNLHETITRN
ncbi:MAG: PSD1 and planctomycete cytochrome C domain-containing protein [Planctomycetes bacterium]|nr:PSD1 and planctomycete cytochrome C domain-containing protein [Planctomycetota bacterium]